MPELCV